MSQISITVSETAHWHALISRAEYHAHRLLPPGVEDYLVRLFIRFEQEENISFQINTPPTKMKASTEYKLQRLGDQCLLLCGFYPEASDEYGVALDEFIVMGREAYQKLSELNGIDAIIFEYLAGNFEQVSKLLCYINDAAVTSFDSQNTMKTQEHKDVFSIQANQIEHYPFSSPISSRVLN